MRVYELANELKMPTAQLLDVCRENSIAAENHFASVSEVQAEHLRKLVGSRTEDARPGDVKKPSAKLVTAGVLAAQLHTKQRYILELLNTGVITGRPDTDNPRRILFEPDKAREQIRAAHERRNQTADDS